MANQTVSQLDESIIIKLSDPYEKVERVTGYQDEIIGENTSNQFQRYFRWSQDNKNYSDWILMTNLNLENQVIDPAKPFWIEYKYTVIEIETGHTMEFVSIALEIVTDQGIVRNVKQVSVDCCEPGSMPSGCANLLIEECCDEDNLFNPYGMMSNTVNMFTQLTNVTNNIFGHCVKYFKVDPDIRSRDVILKEYSLYNVTAVKDIKILFPDNTFPTNDFQFNQFGMDFEVFEVHITREQFQTAFGARTRPNERDYIYIPLIDRMYEVNSVALADPVFYKDIFYKVTLRKYQERENANIESEVIKDQLDKLVLTVDELFEDEIQNETLKITKPQQYKTIGTGANDYIRSELSEQLKISDSLINNNWTIVSKNNYELNKLGANQLAVKYRQPAKFTETDDRAFTMWFQPDFPTEKSFTTIASITNNSGKTCLNMTDVLNWNIGDLIQIQNSGPYNGYHRVVEVNTNSTSFTLDVNYTVSAVAGQARARVKAFLIYGYGDLPSGFSAEITAQFIIVSINNIDHFFEHNITLSSSKWYSIVINLSNLFKTLSIYVYELNKPLNFTTPQLESSALELVYNQLILLDDKVAIETNDYWSLISGPIKLTNIRIFTKIIEEESHNRVLNQYVVNDTQLAELVDNAIPEIRLLRIPNPR